MIAAALSAAFGTFLMGKLAKYPFALAPGVGIVPFFAYSVVIAMKISWQFAMMAVFIEGLIFILTVITAKLYHRRVTGALLWGILITWGLGIVCQATGICRVNPAAGMLSLYPSLGLRSCGQAFTEFFSLVGQCLNVDKWSSQDSSVTGLRLLLSINFLVVIFTLLFDDLFNTIGTLAGIASATGMLTRDGRLPRARHALLADAIATSAGALIGATTTTTYVESATGILAGGRTRFTAYATAGWFVLSIVLAPIFTAIPAFAIAPALLLVGYCMVSQITRIDFRDLPVALPCLAAIVIMPFSYNIADGIFFGFISWTVVNLLCGRRENVNAFLIVLSILFVLKYILL